MDHLDETKRLALETGREIEEIIDGAPFGYMELCTCGHIKDGHHGGTRQVHGGCEECRGNSSIHIFEGTNHYGTLHPGLGHWVEGEWVYDEIWEKFKDDRYQRMFPKE